MSQMVSRCLPHNQLSVSNLSKVVTQWLEVDSNIQLLGYKAQNISLHHCVLYTEAAEIYLIKIIITGSCKVSLSEACLVIMDESDHYTVPRPFVYGHFVYDTSSTDISSTDISSTTVYQRTGQLYIQLLFQQIIIFIDSNFYLHYDSFLSIPLLLTL